VANSFFQFKQFTIHQDKCAMKVCTDACLFGALVADELQHHTIFDILDIGTGTGLLSLMIAQKNNAVIDAVEIDKQAYEQAEENIQQSNYKESITAFHCSINNFFPDHQYDFIISNPPFFEDDLLSDNKKKNAAKHNTTLTLKEVLNNIERLLNADGLFAILLPYHRSIYFEEESLKLNFHLTKKVLVKQTPKHDYFRIILIFSRLKSAAVTNEITIKNEAGNYSGEFIELLQDYYLYL
jgi:tRNA1Val (adenine37-N6)-methyltransferase